MESEKLRKQALELVPSLVLGDPRFYTVPSLNMDIRESISTLSNADIITSNLDSPQSMLASLLYREASQIALHFRNPRFLQLALSSWFSFLSHTKAKDGRVLKTVLRSLEWREEEEEEERGWSLFRRKEKKKEKGEEK